jgi:hypothetical protein
MSHGVVGAEAARSFVCIVSSLLSNCATGTRSPAVAALASAPPQLRDARYRESQFPGSRPSRFDPYAARLLSQHPFATRARRKSQLPDGG